jgi:hypothetical protein
MFKRDLMVGYFVLFFHGLTILFEQRGKTNRMIAEQDEESTIMYLNISMMNKTRFLVGVAYTQNELHAPEFDVRTMREQGSAFPSSTFTC